MQTQCPHCETKFRVTENQVNTADGFVRCSVCKEVFNAIEVADQQDPKNDGAEAETVDFNETSATDDHRKDAFDFFDEEATESLPHVVPEKYKDSHPSSSSTLISGLLWGIGILLLSATLVIEYTWFNRDQLNQIPYLQEWTERLCQQIECKDLTMRNPEKIELISRNVYSHPNEKNALMINITMKNHAEYAQPYPVMQINFSNVRGGRVAARRFLPTEYLPEELLSYAQEQPLLLEPETNMTFTMEIQDPGKQAMTYEFDFL